MNNESKLKQSLPPKSDELDTGFCEKCAGTKWTYECEHYPNKHMINGTLKNCSECRKINCICPKQIGGKPLETPPSYSEIPNSSVVKENFTTPPSQEEWKNSLRDVYIRCLNMPGKNLAFEDYIVPKVCQIREQAIEEGVDEGLSASKILWHRMEIWQNEWQAEKPKERALTHEDALRLIEWKINKAYYLGHLQGFRDTATRALKDMDADVKAIQTEALEAYKTSLRAKIEAMKLPTCSAKTGELCECPKNKFEHNACLDEVLKLLE